MKRDPATSRSLSLREAAARRLNRQTAAVAEALQAWKTLRKAEKEGEDSSAAMAELRTALDRLEYEFEQA